MIWLQMKIQNLTFKNFNIFLVPYIFFPFLEKKKIICENFLWFLISDPFFDVFRKLLFLIDDPFSPFYFCGSLLPARPLNKTGLLKMVKIGPCRRKTNIENSNQSFAQCSL